MAALMKWVQDNPEAASALAYALLSVLNAALKKRGGWAGGIADKLHLVMDRVSFLARSDGHEQTLKLPGTKSRTRPSSGPPPVPEV